jgi:preprotein translocase subunit SecE
MALQEQLDGLRQAGPRAATFLGEVWTELKKVHWPSRKETYTATVVVVVVTMIVAMYLGLVDFGLSYLVRLLLG